MIAIKAKMEWNNNETSVKDESEEDYNSQVRL